MKNWNMIKLLNAIDKKYTDIQNYFIDDIPYFKYAEDMRNSISVSRIDLCTTTKEMLDYKEE